MEPAGEPVDEVAVRLGTGLRRAIEIADVTQAELARRLGVPPNYVSRWIAGSGSMGRRLDLETIEQAEHVMGLTPGTVLRHAQFVDDGTLIDVGSLPEGAQRSVRAILREYGVDGGEGVGGDGVDRSEGVI